VRGRVTFDSAAAHPRFLSMMLSPADAASVIDGSNTVLGRVAADGTFALEGVPPGHYTISTALDPREGWKLASAVWRGSDVADIPLTVAYENLEGIAATLTTRQTTLSGTLTGAAGEPIGGIDVVLFPLDERMRIHNTRRVASSRTTVAGEYEIRGLPPGAYGVAVVDDVDPEALRDPAVLAQLRPVSTVTLDASDTRHDIALKR